MACGDPPLSQHPCPSCGHCPTCGRGGHYGVNPYWTPYPAWVTYAPWVYTYTFGQPVTGDSVTVSAVDGSNTVSSPGGQ